MFTTAVTVLPPEDSSRSIRLDIARKMVATWRIAANFEAATRPWVIEQEQTFGVALLPVDPTIKKQPARELSAIISAPPKPLINAQTRLLKITEVLARIPYSRTQLYELTATGGFPKPVHLGGHASFWIEEEVVDWLASRVGEYRV